MPIIVPGGGSGALSTPSGYGPHDPANAYSSGDRALYLGIPVTANGAIPASTAFSWGTSGATWSPILSSGLAYKGVYSSTNTYAVNDVVCVSSTSRLYVAQSAINTGSANAPDIGANSNLWRSIINNTGLDFRGCTSSANGQAGSVPAPTTGQQNKPLLGSGGIRGGDKCCNKVGVSVWTSLSVCVQDC